MFPLQPKFCLFIRKQSSKGNSIKSNNQKKQHQFIYVQSKRKRKKVPALKNLQSNKLRGGLDYRHKISNHGLAGLFLQLNTCLQSYIHLHHPQEIEEAQADS